MTNGIITDMKSLRVPCDECAIEDIASIESELISAMNASETRAAGLAANQIGINARVFVMVNGSEIITIANPKIIRTFGKQSASIEGCLSLPRVQSMVKRSVKVTIGYTNRSTLEYVERTFRQFQARVVQHEIDHLNGILMIDREIKR